jgi:hypothetical protein
MYVGEVYSAKEQKTFTMYADTVDRAAAFKAMAKIRAQNGNLSVRPDYKRPSSGQGGNR